MARARTILQLVRFPNVFTAWADVALGYLITAGLPDGSWAYWGMGFGLVLISTCLYTGGMALNDVMDAEIDARERPFRPIPSGQISLQRAGRWAWGLLALGCLSAGMVSLFVGILPLLIALALTFSIVIYNVGLKATWVGPAGMGLCRAWNVLLGASVSGLFHESARLAALTVGSYIVGVTILAKDEAGKSKAVSLWLGSGVMVLSLSMTFLAIIIGSHAVHTDSHLWVFILLMVLLTSYLTWFVWRPVFRKSAEHVQRAVKMAILGVIGLDACLAFAVVGEPGLLLLVLALPALWFGRWLYVT